MAAAAPPAPATNSYAKDHLVSVGAGAAAGICSTCVVNPLDTLRVRLAASRDATGTTSKSLRAHLGEMFKGGFQAGFGGGLLINLIASTPSNAVYLSSYRLLNYETTQLGMSHHAVPIVSAAGAVCCTNLTLSPLFVLRTRVQIDSSQNFWHYAKEIMAREGLKGFYRGTMTNIAGRMVEEATFWYIFETMKRVTSEGQLVSKKGTADQSHAASDGALSFAKASLGVLGLSSLSKLCGTSISYPYNVVMVHLREVDKASGVHKHVRVGPTISHIYKADGMRGFYKGLSPHLLRSVVSKATQIYAFELIMSVYSVQK